MTRRLIAAGQRPVTVGTFFSLGHSTYAPILSLLAIHQQHHLKTLSILNIPMQSQYRARHLHRSSRHCIRHQLEIRGLQPSRRHHRHLRLRRLPPHPRALERVYLLQASAAAPAIDPFVPGSRADLHDPRRRMFVLCLQEAVQIHRSVSPVFYLSSDLSRS